MMNLSDKEIGERLRTAREAARLTQAQAAQAINVARTTLVAIEQGIRHAKIDEIQRLALLYRVSANSILRNESTNINIKPFFRKLNGCKDMDAEDSFKILESLIKAEVELENVLGVKRIKNYPPVKNIYQGNIEKQAEVDAQELRNWLGIGAVSPIINLYSILDLQMGIRIYIRKLPSKISGLFAFDKNAGACMLLNADHPIDRLRQSAAHESGHFMTCRDNVEVLFDNEDMVSREEKYAGCFGRYFLTPQRAVQEKFSDLVAGQTRLTRRHIIILANYFGVSREAITRRLEELELVRKGTWNWFEDNGGITDVQAEEVLGKSYKKYLGKEFQGILPPRLLLLAQEAWKKNIYSEGQLADLLSLDRYQIRDIIIDAEEEDDHNEFLKLPN